MVDDIKVLNWNEYKNPIKGAVLIKDTAFVKSYINQFYISATGSDVIAVNLSYGGEKKVKAKIAKEYIEHLLIFLKRVGINYLYVADAEYFKYLTKVSNTSKHHGEILPCGWKGYEHISCILGTNYQATFYNPMAENPLKESIKMFSEVIHGTYVDETKNIIKSSTYTCDPSILSSLLSHTTLAIDIECSGKEEGDALRFNKSSLETIAFSPDESSGVVLDIGNDPIKKKALKEFFKNYTGKCVYHNGLFDIKHLIYHLFMDSSVDIIGMFEGIKTLTKNIDDTMIMTYLATNNVSENTLGLKENTRSYTGNYAVDVTDVNSIPRQKLYEYNLKDTLATFWLYKQRSVDLKLEKQEEVYKIYKEFFEVLLEMMLIGLPLDPSRVKEVDVELSSKVAVLYRDLRKDPLIQKLESTLLAKELIARNSALKIKQLKLEDLDPIEFNPNSVAHKQLLLYDEEFMNLPVIEKTKTKQPATGNKVIEQLIHHTTFHRETLQKLIKYLEAAKILNTFIKAFKEKAFTRLDGTTWLNGEHKIGGTISGRLSSKDPNLANLPSGSKYGKDVKSCFKAPPGWLFCGADFSALEDRIVAILSGDPMKQKPFIDGVDGHCLNTYGYWKEEVESVLGPKPDDNDIDWFKNFKEQTKEDQYLDTLRNKSKAPTFALNYNGTYMTLYKNCGIPIEEAKAIEKGHKTIYHVLHKWSQENRSKMSMGYIECALGLKIRTPIISRSLLGSSITPNLVDNEFRSANNGVSQSWGVLTVRAGKEFRQRLEASPYRNDVLLINFIHDAIYLLIKEKVEVIEWVNNNLIDCMAWQEGIIAHDKIKMEAELDIGYSWDKQYTLKNKASQEDIRDLLTKLKVA